jgi:hypothetical protein
VHAEALDGARERPGEMGEQATKVSNLEATQVELPAGDGQEKRAILGVEEIDAAVAAVVVADGRESRSRWRRPLLSSSRLERNSR